MRSDASPSTELVGGLYATLAFGFWGFVPLYWKHVAFVPGLEMLAHRIVWAVPVLLALLALRGRLGRIREALGNPRHRRLLALTAALVASNWFVFIYAVTHDHVLDASLGYYLNPLVNVLLGFLFLGERLTRRQIAAVLLAAAGVATLVVAAGVFPWVALFLAGSFGSYGLLRKRAGVEALPGLAVEALLLLPLALGLLVVLSLRGEGAFLERGAGGALAIAASGLVTALPLLWFTEAARRLRYATVGFFQYLAPTGQFLLAVLVFGERFTTAHAVAFGAIWLAVALYLLDAARGPRVVSGSPVPARR